MESRVTYQQKKRKKKKLRFRKWVIVVFLLFFLGIFTFSAYKIYAWYSDNKKVDNLTDDNNHSIGYGIVLVLSVIGIGAIVLLKYKKEN